jgi:hypothetical protein
MRLWLPLISLVAATAPGCIVYEQDGCDGCGWDDDQDWSDDWCDTEDGSTDCDTDGDDDGEEPAFSLTFAPGQAEQGETFVGKLTVEGSFDLQTVTGVRFTGGVDVLWSELREGELRVLVDVPATSELGAVDLIVARDGGPSLLVEGALFVGEPGSGSSSDDCE